MADKRVEHGIARLAARQHGVLATRQLAELGVGRDFASRWASKGRLHRVHRGVYAVGHPGLSREGGWMAAVLACGNGAVLSHRSAAALWGMLDPHGPIDVTVPVAGGRRPRPGVRIHRRPTLAATATTSRRAIPVTRPEQTIADLRRSLPEARLRQAIRRAEVLGLPTGLGGRAQATRSELEDLFLRLCRRLGLPAPAVNTRVGPLEVDFLWPERRLVVETDGYRYHRGASAFENDHARDLRLRAAGFDVLRLTYRQLRSEPDRVGALIRRELGGAQSPLRD